METQKHSFAFLPLLNSKRLHHWICEKGILHSNAFRMKASSYLMFMLISFGTSNLKSQTLEFCGVPTSHEANAISPDSIIYDRFGNTYDLYITEDEYGSDAMARALAGYFDIRFNLSALEVDLRPALIDVFEYISNTIDRRTNTTGCSESIEPDLVRIYVTSDAGLHLPVLASGSPTYYVGYSVPCDEVAANRVDLKINGGLHNQGFDGIISVNPDHDINWYVGAGSPVSGEIDAFSVFLHEALHVMGFASLIDEDGEAFSSYFSVWDQFLRTTTEYGSSLNIEELITSDCDVNCWELNDETFEDAEDFTHALKNNCSFGGSIDFVFGDNAIAPLSGGAGNVLNALSHLSKDCNGQDVNYVMQPGLGIQEERRTISDPELEILCQLGYKVGACDNCYLTVLPEDTRFETFFSCCETFYTGCEGQEMIIDFADLMCNDFSSDGTEITDYYNAGGSGLTIVATGSSFQITPTEQGLHSFAYTVKGTSCSGCRMLNGFVGINVGPCTTICDEVDPCENLVCVSDFEDFEPGIGLLAVHQQAMGEYWHSIGDNSLDICEDENGNNYLHIGSFPSNREALCMKLSEPLGIGCTLHVSFDASCYQEDNVFACYMSQYPPCANNLMQVDYDGAPTDCGGYIFTPFHIMDVTVSGVSSAPPDVYCLEDPGLNPYSFDWLNNFGELNYLIIFPGPKNNDHWNNYMDNILVTKDCLDPDFTYEITGECLELEFTSDDQSGGITHDWGFGDTETSSDTDPTHEYSSPGSYSVSHTVTDICGNSATVIHEIMTGNCCADFTVTTLTTWDGTNLPPYNGIFHTLTVQEGAKLYIEAGIVLKFCPGGSLVIEHGAFAGSRGTLTSLGDLGWQGVFVEGRADVSQTANCGAYSGSANCIPQGFFRGDEGSVIENADIAIRNYGPSPGTTSGGIIVANNSTFLNNSIGVDFGPYKNFSIISGQPLPAVASFTECNFTNTSGYSIHVPFEAFIRIREMDGVRVYGCDFQSQLPTSNPNPYQFDYFGKGIHATGSTFLVAAADGTSNPTVPCLPGDCYAVRNTFNGLAHAIIVDQETSVRPYTIIQCDIENCYRGITSLWSGGGTMLFNTFTFGQVPYKFSSFGQFDGQIGIQLYFGHPGFEIQQNDFTYDDDPTGITRSIGILCDGIGIAENEIRKNHFDGIHIAHEAFHQNANNSEVNSSGLVYLCESIENTPAHGVDLYVADTDSEIISDPCGPYETLDNIHYLQAKRNISGLPALLPAGNEFAYSGTDIVNENCSNGFDEFFFYYWYDSDHQEPTSPEVNYLFMDYELEDENECEEDYCVPSCIVHGDIADAKDDFYILQSVIKQNVEDYWTAINEVDAETAEAKNLEALANTHQAFRTAYDIVSEMWRDTIDFDIDTLIKWYSHLNTYDSDLMIAGELAYQGRMGDALDFLDDLSMNRDLTPLQEKDLENVEIIYKMLDVTDIEDLLSAQKDTIRSIAQSDIGSSSGIARAILSSFGENHPLPYYMGESNDPPIRYRKEDSKTQSKLIESWMQIMPIPSSQFVTITWRKVEIVPGECSLSIVDMLGHKVHFENIQYGKMETIFDVSTWIKGVYVAILRTDKGVLESKIFVVD
ncbi:MAG: PKD domain-containing protein [Saprospiraceae bacterium]